MAATKSSKKNIKIANPTDTGTKAIPATLDKAEKIKINKMILKMMVCPAKIFANKRIAKAAGLINKLLKISIGTKINLIPVGTPGGLKICPQKYLFEFTNITTKKTNASNKVTAIFPVKLNPNGNKPNKLLTHIKKNKVNNKGINLIYFLPKFGFATLS